MKFVNLIVFSFLVVFGFNGCDKKDPNGMDKVHWDRDMCERCKMVVSDRHHAVQVINPVDGKSYMYDDIGCTVLWFAEEKITWADKAKIWITDVNSGKWIDARTAHYDSGNITPMAFGFAPHKTTDTIAKGKEVLDYTAISKKIFIIKKEKMKKKMMMRAKMKEMENN